MKLIDAHVHLSDKGYSGHISEVIADAKKAGVAALMTNALDLQTCQSDIELAAQHPNLIYPKPKKPV